MLVLKSYQDCYLHLPRDDNLASSRFSIYAPAGVEDSNVNGDGLGTVGLGDDWNASNGSQINSNSEEVELFFAHLRASGLVPGGGYDTTCPTNAYGGQISIQDGALAIAGHVTIFGQLEEPIAKILESRLDDGLSASGRMQADFTSEVMGASTVSSITSYKDTSRYNIAFRL
ncbi:MAG: hypothetical protein ISR69_01815 [Gammaproteobacteria bacterium]|nr:hypothetical protein [Gammaproteobacteria bacterium]